MPKRTTERFLIACLAPVDVRDLQRANAEASPRAEITERGFGGFWRLMTGEPDRVEEREIDALRADDAPEAVHFIDERTAAARVVERLRHLGAEQSAEAFSMIRRVEFPVAERHAMAFLREQSTDIKREIALAGAAVAKQDARMAPRQREPGDMHRSLVVV